MSRDDLKGILIMVLLLGLSVAAFVFAYKLQPKSYDVDKKSMCLKNEPIPLKKIVLIDKSDKWSSENVEKIDNWLSRIYENVPMNSRLNILSISGSINEQTRVKKLFDKCSPGNEKECNALYENCRDIRRNFISAFQDPLFEITTMLSKPGNAETSPLFETMTSIVDDIESSHAEIHIVSDFMENGHKFNFYKKVLPSLKEIIKEYPLPTEARITVYLHMIERRKHKRELLDSVKKLWQGYFMEQGIRVKEAKRFFIAD
jgi:hypothetical protein